MPSPPRLKIVNTSGLGYKTKIYIDDEDVSECFSDVKITAGVKDAVVAHLEAVVCEIQVEDALHVCSCTCSCTLCRRSLWSIPEPNNA